MRTLKRTEMTQKELRLICAELQTSINWGLDSISLQMNDGRKIHLVELQDHLNYYRSAIETITGSLTNVGTKLNKIN